MTTASPDITSLVFSALFDISKPVPEVVLTNGSTVVDASALTWWFVITTPSGATIHNGSATVPDVVEVPWTEEVFANWPQPYRQIEWGNYSVEVFVKDSNEDVFSLKQEVSILRPLDNTAKTLGNFGLARVIADMRCERGQLYVEDTTPYSWNGITPTFTLRRWTVIYPMDASDVQPADFVLENTANGVVPITFSSDGYQLIRLVTAVYDFENGITVKIKYKYKKDFAVECNQDLCPIVCEYEKLVDSVDETNCDTATRNKLAKINGKISLALIAKSQPLCGINIGALIEEIKELGGFTCECGSGANGMGVNGSGINGSSTGGDFTMSIANECGDVTLGVNQVGNNFALSIADKTYVLEAEEGAPNSLIEAFSFEVTTVDCVKTVKLKIDTAKLADWTNDVIPQCCPELVDVVIKGTEDAPASCPASYFPADLWTPDEATNLGTVTDVNGLIGKLQTNALWLAKGIWAAGSYCKQILFRGAGVTGDIRIPVSVVSSGPGDCIDNQKTYTQGFLDYCSGAAVTGMAYPTDIFVDFGAGPDILANVTSYANLIVQLNAAASKPAHITFSAAPLGNTDLVTIADTDCEEETEITIRANVSNEIIYGAGYNSDTQGVVAGIVIGNVRDNTMLGFACGTKSENIPWHVIKIGGSIYTVETNTGHLFKVDVSNPLYPSLAVNLLLPAPAGVVHVPFDGSDPLLNGLTPSHRDVYFATDLQTVHSGFLYAVENSSGSIWKYDLNTDTISDEDWDAKLYGKIPRVVIGTTMWLSKDGAKEADLGLASGVNARDILILDLTTVGTAIAFTTVTVAPVGDEVWAVTYDPIRVVFWITTKNGALIEYDYVGGTVTNTYPNLWNIGGSFTKHVNTHLFNDRLYASSGAQATRYIDLTALDPATQFDPLPSGIAEHYNFLIPSGKCYGLLTYNAGESNPTRGKVAKFTVDGEYIDSIDMSDSGNIYNVVPILNVPTVTPNGYCP